MAGDNFDYPVPQAMPPSYGGVPAAVQPATPAMNMPGGYGGAGTPPPVGAAMPPSQPNPLMQASLPQQPTTQPMAQPAAAQAIQPFGVPPAAAVQGQAQVQPPRTQPAMMSDDSAVDDDDVIWVNRAKRAIVESHGDPHRQVQLIQHLRSQYLKQRFGRIVRTDEA